MTDYRFFSFKNVRAKVLFNIQKPVTTLLPMTSQWRFAKLVNCFVQKLSLIFVLLKQSLAANRIHLPAGWRASIHSAQRTELAAGQLSRFHHKEPVASKFAEYKPNGLSRVGCNVGAYRKLKTKPKTIAELNKAFQVIWGGIQQGCERLLKLSDWKLVLELEAGGGHFEHSQWQWNFASIWSLVNEISLWNGVGAWTF